MNRVIFDYVLGEYVHQWNLVIMYVGETWWFMYLVKYEIWWICEDVKTYLSNIMLVCLMIEYIVGVVVNDFN